MSKHISNVIDVDTIRRQAQAPRAAEENATAKGLFMLFQGWYGSLFLSRYETGNQTEDGKDKGILSAMVIWQAELGGLDGNVVRDAAERCKTEFVKWPPTLPEFMGVVRAVTPRKTYSGPMKVEMSEGLRSSYSMRARTEAMARYRANVNADAGVVNTGGAVGLPLVQLLIAKAVGLAGGDEVAVLRRFDRQRSAA